MDPAAVLVLLLWTSGTFLTATGTQNVTAWYGNTIVVPCQGGNPPPHNLMFVKWKIDRPDGTDGDLLVKQAQSDRATIQATDGYAQRVSVDEQYSLHITKATLQDQHTYICLVVSEDDLQPFPVHVSVHKKPSPVRIMDVSEVLNKDKLTTVGTCVVADANPAASITWRKGEDQLEVDGKAVVMVSSLQVDAATGLSTTSSTLLFAATRKDGDSIFSCVSTYQGSDEQSHLDPFPIHYPSEEARLEILSKPSIVEGDNVTLRCWADGNPPPRSFFFSFQHRKILVENSDNYTFSSVSREASGEYRCSLPENEEVQASRHILVNYLDLSLRPSGTIVKMLGDFLSVTVEKNSSAEASVSWTKDGKMAEEPGIKNLTYADAGVYMVTVSMGQLTRSENLELVVEGSPVITSLTKHKTNDSKLQVVCEAEGFPEPRFNWNIDRHTIIGRSYKNGKAVQNITVVPQTNLTIFCNVSNKLGEDVRTISVHPDFQRRIDKKESQEVISAGVAVGVFLVLIVVGGVLYWLYKQNRRRGSFNTENKNVKTAEETVKLAGNNV